MQAEIHPVTLRNSLRMNVALLTPASEWYKGVRIVRRDDGATSEINEFCVGSYGKCKKHTAGLWSGVVSEHLKKHPTALVDPHSLRIALWASKNHRAIRWSVPRMVKEFLVEQARPYLALVTSVDASEVLESKEMVPLIQYSEMDAVAGLMYYEVVGNLALFVAWARAKDYWVRMAEKICRPYMGYPSHEAAFLREQTVQLIKELQMVYVEL